MTDNNLFLMEIEDLCNFSSPYRRLTYLFQHQTDSDVNLRNIS